MSRRILQILFANVSILTILIVGGELFGQLAYYVVYGKPLFTTYGRASGPHVDLFEQHPYLVGRLKPNIRAEYAGVTVSTTEFHTRSTRETPCPADAIKIAALGGSTTFGIRTADADTWPARLQAILGDKYCVINYGVPGYSTAENIIQLALLVPEARPDVLVICAGWNDIRTYHMPNLGPDYFAHGMSQFDNLVIRSPERKTAIGNLVQASALFRFGSFAAEQLGLSRVEPPPSPIPRSDPDPAVDDLYVRNLKTLHTLARHFDSQIVFVPQVLNVAEYAGKKGTSHSWSPYVEDAAMPALLARFNALMDSVCEGDSIHCSVLNDVTSTSWTPDDFVDDGHFSPAGNAKLANIISPKILQDVTGGLKR